MIKVETLNRVFEYSGVILPDPNPEFSVEEARDMYVATYPELATAAVEGPRATSQGMKYTFVASAGIKG